MKEPAFFDRPEPPLTAPEVFSQPEKLIIVASLGLIKQISERRNPFSIKKLGMAFLVAVTFINANLAVADAPSVPPEPLRASASFFVTPNKEISQKPEVVKPPVLTKVDVFEANTRATLSEYKDVFNIKEGEEENLVHLMTAIGQAESDLKSGAVNGKDKGVMQIRLPAAQDVITRLGPQKAKEFLKKYGIDRSEIKEEDLDNPALSEEVAKLYVLICREDILKLKIDDETIIDGLTAFVYNAGRGDGMNMIRNTMYYKGNVTVQGVVQMAKTNAEKIWDKYHITREKIEKLEKHVGRYDYFLKTK